MNYRNGNSLATLALLVWAVTLNPQLSTLLAQGTAFTYQGRLNDGATLATGIYDLRFAVYDTASDGGQVGPAITNAAIAVSNGLFTVALDFGAGVFTGADRWLEIGVRTNGPGSSGFVTLSPRQPLTPAPYALRAANAGTVPGAGIVGTVADTSLSSNIARLNATNQAFSGPVNFNNPSNTFAGTFTGSGGGLSQVPASSLVLVSNRTVLGWGLNYFGQATIPSGANSAIAIAAGDYHSLALKTDGTVIGWGNNSYGEPDIPAGATNVTAIAAGAYHSLALKADGTVIGWGSNSSGQTTTPASATNVIAIAAGAFHSLALKTDGTVIGWGYNGSGQTTIPASATNVIAIAAGGDHSLALKADGTVIGWGQNDSGETTIPAGATDVTAIAAGAYHSLALKADGTVIGWGHNTYGQTTIPAAATNVIAIAAGHYHSLAVKADGTVIGWGHNAYGQTTIPAAATNVIALAAGWYHSLALRVQTDPLLPGGVLSDSVRSQNFASLDVSNKFTANNTFAANLTIAAPASLSFGSATRQMLNLWGTSYGIGVQPGTLYFRTDAADAGNGFAWFKGGVHAGGVKDPGPGGTRLMSLDANALSVSPRLLELGAGMAKQADAGKIGYQVFSGDALDIVGAGTTDTNRKITLWSEGGANVTGPMWFGSTTRQMLNLYGSAYGIGVQNGSLYFRCNDASTVEGFSWYKGGVHNDANGSAGGGVELMHLTAGGLWVNGTFVSASDRNAKENFSRVDPRAVLDKVAALPLSEWNYKQDAATRHLGPMAQDFYAAFGVGPDDKHIATVDADGVALAAIQGLDQKLEEQRSQLEQKETEITELKHRLEELERVVNQKVNRGAQ